MTFRLGCVLMMPQELRVECYRVSYLATGHAPMPVTTDSATWDTIPPFYSPCVREAPEVSGFGSGALDVTMNDGVSASPAHHNPLIVHVVHAVRSW